MAQPLFSFRQLVAIFQAMAGPGSAIASCAWDVTQRMGEYQNQKLPLLFLEAEHRVSPVPEPNNQMTRLRLDFSFWVLDDIQQQTSQPSPLLARESPLVAADKTLGLVQGIYKLLKTNMPKAYNGLTVNPFDAVYMEKVDGKMLYGYRVDISLSVPYAIWACTEEISNPFAPGVLPNCT